VTLEPVKKSGMLTPPKPPRFSELKISRIFLTDNNTRGRPDPGNKDLVNSEEKRNNCPIEVIGVEDDFSIYLSFTSLLTYLIIPGKVKGRPAEFFLVTSRREVRGLQYSLDLRSGVHPRAQDSGHVHPPAKGGSNDKTG